MTEFAACCSCVSRVLTSCFPLAPKLPPVAAALSLLCPDCARVVNCMWILCGNAADALQAADSNKDCVCQAGAHAAECDISCSTAQQSCTVQSNQVCYMKAWGLHVKCLAHAASMSNRILMTVITSNSTAPRAAAAAANAFHSLQMADKLIQC